ncbi:hypothetical protein [Roseobacter litoralis]|uniref:hypothetical protein n=1 Tax=Roseobacter litoralis TaxID=42443 RepID=UPI0024954300|nr:hypothetical protein [Roseobacter litoralis]
MTNVNADSANNTARLETSAFAEHGAFDLSSTEGRIAFFCARYECEPPELEYDQDEPQAILLTDDLISWTRREGVNLDWLFCGSVAGLLPVYRERYRMSAQVEEFGSLVGKLDDAEQNMLLGGLMLCTKAGADVDEVMQLTSQKINEHRANKS